MPICSQCHQEYHGDACPWVSAERRRILTERQQQSMAEAAAAMDADPAADSFAGHATPYAAWHDPIVLSDEEYAELMDFLHNAPAHPLPANYIPIEEISDEDLLKRLKIR